MDTGNGLHDEPQEAASERQPAQQPVQPPAQPPAQKPNDADGPLPSESARLEALLQTLPAEHQWEEMGRKVIERIEELPVVEETVISSWLLWLFVASMLGVVAMGWLRIAPRLGGRAALERVLPAAGTSLMIVSALGLVWVAVGAVAPRAGSERFRPTMRWLMVGAGWSAALVGSVVALIPLASSRAIPPGVIPLLILLAVSGLVAGLAQEMRYERDSLALASDDLLRRLALGLGVVLAACGAIMEAWFIIFWLPK